MTIPAVFLCLALFIPLRPVSAAPALNVFTSQVKYFRYEFVRVFADLKEVNPKEHPHLVATFYRKNQQVIGPGEFKNLYLVYNKKLKHWSGLWPVPWAPELGKYRVKVRAVIPGPKPKIISNFADFEITGRQPVRIPNGFSVLTFESRPDLFDRIPPPPGVNRPDCWENIISWTKFLGADAVWQRVADTTIINTRIASEYPFGRKNLIMVDKISKLAHECGVKFGGWIVAWVVWGNKPELADYKFTKWRSKDTGKIESSRFISMDDPKRRKEIIELLRKMDENPNIDYIGFDYWRIGFGGLEYVDRFVAEMCINVPENWEKLDHTGRMEWLANEVEQKRFGNVERRWQWWRAHVGAEELREILSMAKVTKPVWIFTLGWDQGKEHGQDPMMLVDAGASINTIMLYESDRPVLASMRESWSKYIKTSMSNFVLGESFDWNIHQKFVNPPCPAEVAERQWKMVDTFFSTHNNAGIFWHDIGRTVYGSMGPYSKIEWIAAAGKNISKLKQAANRLPVRMTLSGPPEAEVGGDIETTAEITCTGNQRFNVELLQTPCLSATGSRSFAVDFSSAKTHSVKFKVKIEKDRPAADHWLMVAVLVSPVDGNYKNRIFDYYYLRIKAKKEADK